MKIFNEDDNNMNYSFSEHVKQLIKQIPPGKVATYGQIATYAGNPRASRQVSWILHSCSRKYYFNPLKISLN